MTIVIPTDRPKSVRNRCVIEVFGGVFVFSHCFLDLSVGVGAFVIGRSQISSFFTIRLTARYGVFMSLDVDFKCKVPSYQYIVSLYQDIVFFLSIHCVEILWCDETNI